MRFLSGIVIVVAVTGLIVNAQTKPRRAQPSASARTAEPSEFPAAVPVKKGAERSETKGPAYANAEFGFAVTFPATWLIPGEDFEREMKNAGFDLSLSAPPELNGVERVRMDRALQNVKILATAYRSMPGSADNAIVRISAEDLLTNPQINDAVDYFDAMRSQFAAMKLPPEFKYSETGAEKLGKHQFGYLDTSGQAGKKRLYATVRKGHAILFTITYTKDEDLQVLRKVLAEGKF